VLHPDDARRAVARGIDAVWVSNHGGRQSALWPSAISAVPAVAEAVDGRVPVLFDGGLRRGGEVLKALSLGAQAAFFGRPLLWSVAVAGQAGAEACLAQLGEQLESSMALLGVADVGSFAQRALHASAALAAAAQRREEAAS
jgi:(S)-mandelate dehydrogenase